MNGAPSLAILAFYTINLIIVFGYLAAAALMLRPRGFIGQGRQPWVAVISACVFFICCALIHLDIAYHAYAAKPFFIWTRPMPIDWHFFITICVKLVALWTFILTSAASPRSEPLCPTSAPHLRQKTSDRRDQVDHHSEA